MQYLVSNLFWDQVVAFHVKISRINIKSDVRQKCVLSPNWFILYTENIYKQLEGLVGLNITGRIINNLRDADNTKLLAENEHQFKVPVAQANSNIGEC